MAKRPLFSSLDRFRLIVAASTLEKSAGGKTISGILPPIM